MHTTPLLALHRTAVLASVDVVSRVRADDLGRPTPCSEWTLADLIAHMTVQHKGFAAAARGDGGDPAVWKIRPIADNPVGDDPIGHDPIADNPVADDPVAGYIAAAHQVLAAFAEDGVLDREFTLAEFHPVSTFPAAQAIGFHLIDYVVHGWDVARAIGIRYELDPALAEPALRIAMAVPNGTNRIEPGAAFAPALSTPEDAASLDRILTALGRSPAWPG